MPGWRVEVKTRNSGTSAGTSDAVSPQTDSHSFVSHIAMSFLSGLAVTTLMTHAHCLIPSKERLPDAKPLSNLPATPVT